MWQMQLFGRLTVAAVERGFPFRGERIFPRVVRSRVNDLQKPEIFSAILVEFILVRCSTGPESDVGVFHNKWIIAAFFGNLVDVR